MSIVIPIPLWLLLLILVLSSAQIALVTWQTKNLRDLFDMYWRAEYGEESHPDQPIGKCANCDTNGPPCACLDFAPKAEA